MLVRDDICVLNLRYARNGRGCGCIRGCPAGSGTYFPFWDSFRIRSRTTLREYAEARTRALSGRHMTLNHLYEIEGDRATGRATTLVSIATPSGYKIMGRYARGTTIDYAGALACPSNTAKGKPPGGAAAIASAKPALAQIEFAPDSPLEGTGSELSVPSRNESKDRAFLLALWGLADDELPLVLARYPPRVVTLSLCRRRHEAADLSGEQPGEFDRRRVLDLWPDNLQAHR
jgi:hypothetical protein